MTGYIGVFGDCTGFRFEKPRPGNPYGAWAAGSYRGFRGFISTTGKFFKNDHPYRLDQSGSPEKIFQRPKKTIKTPKTPFSPSNRGPLLPGTDHHQCADPDQYRLQYCPVRTDSNCPGHPYCIQCFEDQDRQPGQSHQKAGSDSSQSQSSYQEIWIPPGQQNQASRSQESCGYPG